MFQIVPIGHDGRKQPILSEAHALNLLDLKVNCQWEEVSSINLGLGSAESWRYAHIWGRVQ